MVDSLDQGAGIGGSGQEIALEAIEVFDGQHDLGFLRLLGGLAEDLDGPFLLIGVRPAAGEDAERRVIRSGQDFAAEHSCHLDGPFQMIETGLPQARIGTDRIGGWRGTADRGAAKTVIVQLFADRLVMGSISRKQRDFHTVKARLLELGKEWEMLLRDMRGPQKEVHAGLHQYVSVASIYRGTVAPYCPAGALFWQVGE